MKVLIVTHNPITTFNNMGKTLLSLFHCFDKEELCQFYIYPTIPDVHKCESYYRITDKDVFKSCISFWRSTGREIREEEISGEQRLYEAPGEQVLYRDKNKRKELKLIIRSLAWSVGKWHTKEFRAWISHHKPDLIFACGGQSSFFYDVILALSHRHKIPVVTYVCDDFFFSSQNRKDSFLKGLYYKILRKKISCLLRESKGVVTICDSMTKDYGDAFGCTPLTISTGADVSNLLRMQQSTQRVSDNCIRYFGNLQLNRWESLLQIGMALREINHKYKSNYSLEIYTADPIPPEFEKVPAIRVMGFVDSNSLQSLMMSSILLIHAESFREEDVERVRYSVSTKIAESLWSGVPLFAYGSEEIASVSHLHMNHCAFICNDKNCLVDRLTDAIYNDAERQRIIQNAMNTATKYHDRDCNSNLLYSYLQSIMEDTIET